MTTDARIKAFAASIGLAGFMFGVLQYFHTQSIEAAKPYLHKKLDFCVEAVETAAKIAESNTYPDAEIARFLEMYWGVMGLIENEVVNGAMVGFKDEVSKIKSAQRDGLSDAHIPATAKSKALQLAHACRDELSREWSPFWKRL